MPGLVAVVSFFLLSFFFYVWFRIEPAVEYQHSSPVFLLTGPFLTQFLEYPGGLLDYAAAGLSQRNSYNWLGALVFTALGGLLWLGARKVMAQVAGADSRAASLGIPLLLLLLRERYDCPVLAMGTGLLAAIALALGYFQLFGIPPATPSTPKPPAKEEARDGSPASRCAPSRAGLRLGICWIGSSLLFYIAGAWACEAFLVLIGLFEGVHRHRKWLGLACALPVPVAAWWLIRLRDVDPVRLLNPWCKGTEGWVLGGALYLFLPLVCAVSVLARRTENRPAGERRPGDRKRSPQRRGPEAKPTGRAVAGGLLVLGCGLVWLGFAVQRKRIAEMDYYSSRGNYERVLAVAPDITREQMDFSSEARLHLALYHMGRLGQDLFSYRNQSGWDLLPGLAGGLESCRAQSETMLELGLVSEAEHLAHEALENEGERPGILRALARVNVLKGRPQAARVFLNVLAQMPFQGRWARTWLRTLERNPPMTGNAELDAIRPLMPTNDLVHQGLPAEGLLVQLLRCNPTNQMAFEYLMGEYLMNREIKKLVDRLSQLDHFKYAGIPRHYEEALLLYQITSRTPVDLRGRSIRSETIERFRRFSDAMNQRVLDTDEGRRAMARDFGDTYWYYYFARQSAAKTS